VVDSLDLNAKAVRVDDVESGTRSFVDGSYAQPLELTSHVFFVETIEAYGDVIDAACWAASAQHEEAAAFQIEPDRTICARRRLDWLGHPKHSSVEVARTLRIADLSDT
jgi:hypothetical protein